MSNDIDILNYYTKGKSIIRGSFPVSTNDQKECNISSTLTSEQQKKIFIDESGVSGNVERDAGCGCDNNYVKFWYPIYGALDNLIYFSPSNTTGYSKGVFNVSNSNTITPSVGGVITSYDCGYTHCNLNISGSFSGEVSDIRGGVYQPVGYIEYNINAGATFYTPNDYLTVTQGSSFGSSAPLGYMKNQGNLFLKNVYGKLNYKFIYYPVYNAPTNGGVLTYDMTLAKSDNTTLYDGGTWSGVGIANSNNTGVGFNAINQVSTPMNNTRFTPSSYYSNYTQLILLPSGLGGFDNQTLPALRNTLGFPINGTAVPWAALSDFFKNLTYTYELTCPV